MSNMVQFEMTSTEERWIKQFQNHSLKVIGGNVISFLSADSIRTYQNPMDNGVNHDCRPWKRVLTTQPSHVGGFGTTVSGDISPCPQSEGRNPVRPFLEFPRTCLQQSKAWTLEAHESPMSSLRMNPFTPGCMQNPMIWNMQSWGAHTIPWVTWLYSSLFQNQSATKNVSMTFPNREYGRCFLFLLVTNPYLMVCPNNENQHL